MPYITQEERRIYGTEFELVLKRLTAHGCQGGHQNYLISRILWTAYKNSPRYNTLEALLSVLQAVALELWRRLGGPHEDEAIRRNGDLPEAPTQGWPKGPTLQGSARGPYD